MTMNTLVLYCKRNCYKNKKKDSNTWWYDEIRKMLEHNPTVSNILVKDLELKGVVTLYNLSLADITFNNCLFEHCTFEGCHFLDFTMTNCTVLHLQFLRCNNLVDNISPFRIMDSCVNFIELKYCKLQNLMLHNNCHTNNLSSTTYQFLYSYISEMLITTEVKDKVKLSSMFSSFAHIKLNYLILSLDMSYSTIGGCSLDTIKIDCLDLVYNRINISFLHCLSWNKLIKQIGQNNTISIPQTLSKSQKEELDRINKVLPYIQREVPEGSFIGWKKAYLKVNDNGTNGTNSPVLIKLEIPEDAQRIISQSGKCRASSVIVLGIYDLNFNLLKAQKAFTVRPQDFPNTIITEYKKGCRVEPDKWDPNPYIECSHGIHFFMNRLSALNY